MSNGTLPRAVDGRAPDVFRSGGWVPMRSYGDDEEVDFAIVGTGAGGGTLAYKLASAGFRVVAFDAGPFWRPLDDFASDEKEQQKLYWQDERISGGTDPIRWYKAPPSLALTEHWNYTDEGKDFFGGYLIASQGPLVREWGLKLALSKGLWGTDLRREMTRYNHMAGLKIVGEIEPAERNRVELVTETDDYGTGEDVCPPMLVPSPSKSATKAIREPT